MVAGKLDSLVVADDQLAGARLTDGTVVPRSVTAVAPRFMARSAPLASLGVASVEHPMGFGEHVEADPMGQTEVTGVYVAGNVNDLAAQVVMAAAARVRAAAGINADPPGLFDE